MAPSPGVSAVTVVPFSVYPPPAVITSTAITFPLEILAFSFAPTPSPLTMMLGILKKSLPPLLIITESILPLRIIGSNDAFEPSTTTTSGL